MLRKLFAIANMVLLSSALHAQSKTALTYDANGRLKSTIEAASSITIEYDASGSVTKATKNSTRKINPTNGNIYELINCGAWVACRTEAKARGANLVTIRSAEEEAWLIATFYPLRQADYGFWIGLNDVAMDGNWVWDSGEAVTYVHWLPGEPNGNAGEYYVHLWFYPTGPGWNDVGDINAPLINQAIIEYTHYSLKSIRRD